MSEWFYADGEERVGPVTEAELVRLVSIGTVERDTLVWTEGMNDWKPAKQVPLLFPATAPPELRRTRREDVESHLAKAIIATILCCLPLGIVSIVYAAQVSGKVAAGDVVGAREASRNADTWANWAIGLGLMAIVGWVLVSVSLGVQ